MEVKAERDGKEGDVGGGEVKSGREKGKRQN